MWKTVISFVMSVPPSVSMEIYFHWTDINKIWYLSFSWRSVTKIQVSLKSGKNYEYFRWRLFHIYNNTSINFLEWGLFQIKVVDNIKTHILCSITFFRKSCSLWDNVETHGGTREPYMKIWLMHFAWCYVICIMACLVFYFFVPEFMNLRNCIEAFLLNNTRCNTNKTTFKFDIFIINAWRDQPYYVFCHTWMSVQATCF